MKILLPFLIIVAIGCSKKENISDYVGSDSEVKEVMERPDTLIFDQPITSSNNLDIELIRWDSITDPYEALGYKNVRIRDGKNEVDFSKRDFEGIYSADFFSRAQIFTAEVLAKDTSSQRLIIRSMFGVPDSDFLTYTLLIFDGQMNLLKVIDDNPDCQLKNRFGQDFFITCDKVYRGSSLVYDFTQCCAVWTSLLNDSTLFFIKNFEEATEIDNSFIINLNSKDTIDSFQFNDFTYTIGYSSLVDWNPSLELTGLIDNDQKVLTIYSSDLEKDVYDINTIPISSDIINELYLMHFSHELLEYMIEFDEHGKPIGIVKSRA